MWMQKQRKKAAYLWKVSGRQGSPARYPHLHCQPLNEVWGGVHPGFTPFGHSGTLHAPELPSVGPAFPPGAQSLLQAVTQHFCYSRLLHGNRRRGLGKPIVAYASGLFPCWKSSYVVSMPVAFCHSHSWDAGSCLQGLLSLCYYARKNVFSFRAE